MTHLTINRSTEGPAQLLRLSGQIDELAQFGEIPSQPGAKLIIDLEGVTRINSVGVREWVRFLRGLRERGVAVTLRRCSETMVLQMNMIEEAHRALVVESFFAPYACEDCAVEQAHLIDVASHRESLRRLQPPSFSCPKCKKPMAFAEVVSRYLAFLSGG